MTLINKSGNLTFSMQHYNSYDTYIINENQRIVPECINCIDYGFYHLNRVFEHFNQVNLKLRLLVIISAFILFIILNYFYYNNMIRFKSKFHKNIYLTAIFLCIIVIMATTMQFVFKIEFNKDIFIEYISGNIT